MGTSLAYSHSVSPQTTLWARPSVSARRSGGFFFEGAHRSLLAVLLLPTHNIRFAPSVVCALQRRAYSSESHGGAADGASSSSVIPYPLTVSFIFYLVCRRRGKWIGVYYNFHCTAICSHDSRHILLLRVLVHATTAATRRRKARSES